MESWLEELSPQECVAFLRANEVGRIGVVLDGVPLVFPINYLVAEVSDRTCLVLRTRSGNSIDCAGPDVAFEIDGIDPAHRRGWSVLLRGTLLRVDPELAGELERLHLTSWLAQDRDTWLILEPSIISGRRLREATIEWAFHETAYL